ncbi:hypothetical protein FB563_0119 [Streptomyces puniciscabiei]|uniref:Uncharacterized protein n=1 Tax=Streptomyces puniciscabiei TaxID=164348 RepID=A0A542U829_9ACTN|nr:hypothetical protein [Streptomyces puniciscabiei]TQK95242.1 hypothetical protein FB563_0119 [Streptomyces puniciscabiei]
MSTPDRLPANGDAVFERLLDQALRSPELSQALRRHAGRPTREDLRARAVAARKAITATAGAEYRDYLELKEASARRDEGAASRAAGGILPVLAVFVPSLSAVAGAVFLALGYGLRALDQARQIGDDLVTTGAVAAVVAVGSGAVDLIWLLVAAARNRSSAGHADHGDRDPRVRQAWDVWQAALLERGMVPFLLGLLERAHMAEEAVRSAREAAAGGAGADSDDPDDDSLSARRPGAIAPDCSSPDFGSPGFTGPTRPHMR